MHRMKKADYEHLVNFSDIVVARTHRPKSSDK
jgi:hypothetical protein